MRDDMITISVFHLPEGPTVVTERYRGGQLRRKKSYNPPTTSTQRLASLACDTRHRPNWDVRPFLGRAIGWVADYSRKKDKGDIIARLKERRSRNIDPVGCRAREEAP